MRVAFVAMETVHHCDDQELADRSDSQGLRRFDRIARDLAAAGHEVTVYCAQWWDGHEPTRTVDGVVYRAVTATPAAPSFCTKLPYVLSRADHDVVHARPRPALAVLAAAVSRSISRTPLVVEWFGDEAVPDATVANLATRQPDLIVTPSERIRTDVRERGVDGEATTVVPEPIDLEAIREADPGERIDIVYAHDLDESANVESLFLGLAELRGKDWSATIVGDGPLREEYEREARDLRIEDRVEFVGSCDREERIALYRGAHVFVQTAFQACFATELLWALACGCVGIVEYQVESSAHELVEGDGRGFRVTSTQGMAGAIVDSADIEHRTIDESYERYDSEAVVAEYEEAYERLLEARGLVA